MPRPTLKNISSENVDAQAVNRDAASPGLIPDEVNTLLTPIVHPGPVAIAVSGGADSMALCLVADQWAKANNRSLIALTVDHGLRADAAKEALSVADWLAARNITHHILTWQGEKPKTGIQAAARAARYHLMAAWCHENDVANLMTAHHLEDQVETFLIRAERGSGLDGLAAMKTVSKVNGVMLLRPLLSISKKRLRANLIDRDQQWIEDPSNQNPAYRRTKMRRLVTALEKSKLSPVKIYGLVGQFAKLRQQFSSVVGVFFERAVQVFPEGYGTLRLDLLQKLPEPILERVLVELTSVFGGKSYPPRRDRLKRAMQNIQKQDFAGFTLGGCRFMSKGHEIMICRETRGLSTIEVHSGDHLNWNGLFTIDIDGTETNPVRLAPLGKIGWSEIVQKKPELKENRVPYSVRLTLPALLDDQGVIEVPQLGYRREGYAPTAVRITTVQFNALKAFKPGL